MRRTKQLPSRAIFAEVDDKTATATWQLKRGVWFCCSTSKWLKWMKGIENFETVKAQLASRGIVWQWIIPNCGTVIKPPF